MKFKIQRNTWFDRKFISCAEEFNFFVKDGWFWRYAGCFVESDISLLEERAKSCVEAYQAKKVILKEINKICEKTYES